MNIRKRIFLLKDKLLGERITTDLQEIKRINKNSTSQEIRNYQNLQINRLLKYAADFVPNYLRFKTLELSKFPVVDKTIVKHKLQDFISLEFKKKNLKRMVTSGSTGTPFVTYQDKRKRYRNIADTIYFGKLAGYKLGEKLYYLKIWSKNNRKTRFLQFIQNIIPVDVIHLDTKETQALIEEFNSNKVNYHILGYTSALEEVLKHLNLNKDNIVRGPSSIITMSEDLPEATKEKLQDHFSCATCSRYSNIENGIIAQQTQKDNANWMVNLASYYVEILNLDNNEPAKPSELGRIVVTDLYNYAMPLIRYDTGDIGLFLVDSNGDINQKYLKKIEGRKLDLLLDTKGDIISSYIMYKNMFYYPEIDQYQLIQETENAYNFKVSMKGTLKNEAKLIREFTSYLGANAIFNIEYVDEVPLLDSGKRRKVVNNYLRKRNDK